MIDALAFLHQLDQIEIAPTARVDRFARVNGGEGCVIGDYVHIAGGAVINAGGGTVVLGGHCGVSNNVVIAAGMPDLRYANISAAEPAHNQHPLRLKTIISPYALIFANATICPGVTVGFGAVIGAGAVVTKDVPDWEVWAGVPAKRIGYRHPTIDGYAVVYDPSASSGQATPESTNPLADLSATDVEAIQSVIAEKYDGLYVSERYARDLAAFVGGLS